MKKYPPPANRRWQDHKVSSHFKLGEFYKDRHELPSRFEVEAVSRFAKTYLEPLRRVYGPGYIVSGHRTREHNAQVGGAPDSRHIYENHPGTVATDIVFERGTPEQWFNAADRLHVGGAGKYDTHLHIDDRPGRARW